MTELTGFKKVIWAVDVFDANKKMHQEAAHVLRSLSERTGASIEAVHLLNVPEMRAGEDFHGPWEEFYSQAAKDTLARWLDEVRPGLGKLGSHVILQRYPTHTHEGVENILEFAAQKNGDLIVVCTHGRSGIKRAVLGSFTEALLLKSPIPVMTIGPDMIHGNHGFDHLIFPTDFAQDAQYAYREAVSFAQQLKSKLVLFHSVPHPIEPIVQSGVSLLGGSWSPLFTFFGEQVERQLKHARAWARWADHQGVEVELQIHSSGGSISDALFGIAREKPGCYIVMVEKVGLITSTLVGSLVRGVVRHAPCPVFAMKPPVASASKKAA